MTDTISCRVSKDEGTLGNESWELLTRSSVAGEERRAVKVESHFGTECTLGVAHIESPVDLHRVADWDSRWDVVVVGTAQHLLPPRSRTCRFVNACRNGLFGC